MIVPADTAAFGRRHALAARRFGLRAAVEHRAWSAGYPIPPELLELLDDLDVVANNPAASDVRVASVSGHAVKIVGMAFLETTHVADRLKVTPRSVTRLIAERKLVAEKVGGRHRIDPASVAALEAQRRTHAKT